MTFIDYFIIFSYFPILFWVGFRIAGKKSSNSIEYLLAGRKVTLPLFVMTLVSTWYGGILGVGEFTYRYGISNWIVFGIPYYLWALIFAFFFAGKIRSTNLVTIPELLEKKFSRSVGLIGAILVFIIVNPAPYFLILAVIISHLFNIPFYLAFSLGIVISILYVYVAGFRSVIYTDVLQFLLMFLGFLLAFIFISNRFGGISFLFNNLPEAHFSPTGGNKSTYIMTWYFIALWTFIDPGFHQRCYAARDPDTAKKGILISVLFWVIFDFLTTAVGLYSRALLPGIEPLNAFPALGDRILPPGFAGIFFLGLLATVMSTVDSYTFLAAMTLGNDLFGKFKKLAFYPERSRTRIGIVLTIVIATVIVVLSRSVINIWYIIGTLVIPSLLLPVILAYYPFIKINEKELIFLMVTAFVINLTLLLGKQFRPDMRFFYDTEPIIGGLSFLTVWIVMKIIRERTFQTS